MALDITLLILGALLIVAGAIGCLLPVIPGPPLSYGGLLLLQLTSKHPFTPRFLIIYAVLTALVLMLDYIIPIYGTKKFKASKYGIWGSTAGMLIGILFFFPLGILLGPMVGAFSGEILSGKAMEQAFRSALGSLLGFLTGTSIKFVLSLSMAYFFLINAF